MPAPDGELATSTARRRIEQAAALPVPAGRGRGGVAAGADGVHFAAAPAHSAAAIAAPAVAAVPVAPAVPLVPVVPGNGFGSFNPLLAMATRATALAEDQHGSIADLRQAALSLTNKSERLCLLMEMADDPPAHAMQLAESAAASADRFHRHACEAADAAARASHVAATAWSAETGLLHVDDAMFRTLTDPQASDIQRGTAFNASSHARRQACSAHLLAQRESFDVQTHLASLHQARQEAQFAFALAEEQARHHGLLPDGPVSSATISDSGDTSGSSQVDDTASSRTDAGSADRARSDAAIRRGGQTR